MRGFRLTERASAELLNIYIFGLKQFGPNQAGIYLDDLERCFALLADNPHIGRLAPGIGYEVRRHEHGSHVILYELAEDGIVVLAVVHGRSVHGLDP